jgi:hypothetical protein
MEMYVWNNPETGFDQMIEVEYSYEIDGRRSFSSNYLRRNSCHLNADFVWIMQDSDGRKFYLDCGELFLAEG